MPGYKTTAPIAVTCRGGCHREDRVKNQKIPNELVRKFNYHITEGMAGLPGDIAIPPVLCLINTGCLHTTGVARLKS